MKTRMTEEFPADIPLNIKEKLFQALTQSIQLQSDVPAQDSKAPAPKDASAQEPPEASQFQKLARQMREPQHDPLAKMPALPPDAIQYDALTEDALDILFPAQKPLPPLVKDPPASEPVTQAPQPVNAIDLTEIESSWPLPEEPQAHQEAFPDAVEDAVFEILELPTDPPSERAGRMADLIDAISPPGLDTEEAIRLAAERLAMELEVAEQAIEEMGGLQALQQETRVQDPPQNPVLSRAAEVNDYTAIYMGDPQLAESLEILEEAPEESDEAFEEEAEREPFEERLTETRLPPPEDEAAPGEATEISPRTRAFADALSLKRPLTNPVPQEAPATANSPSGARKTGAKKRGAKMNFDDKLSVMAPRSEDDHESAPTGDPALQNPFIQGVMLQENRSMGGSMSDLSGYKDLSKAPTMTGESKKEGGSSLLSSHLPNTFDAVSALSSETFSADMNPAEVDTDFNGNFQTLIRLINELPEGVTKQTGAQIIRLTMESMGIFMEDVLSDAQAAQSEMLDAVRANIKKIEEYKTIIRKLETDIKYYQGKANELSEIIDLFILSNTSSKAPNVDEYPSH